MNMSPYYFLIKKIKHLYPCLIAVIKYRYEFGCAWIKSWVC